MRNIFLKENKDTGLLILRCGLGIMMMLHGWPKITGGPEVWKSLGMATASVGIYFAPTLFGFLASVAEFLGGFLLTAGFLFRWANVLLALTMFVATMMHINNGQEFSVFSHPLKLFIIFISLAIIGPGQYSLEKRK